MRRALRGLVGPVAAIAVMVLAFQAPLPYFTEQPGSLFGLAARVEVEGYAEPLDGDVLFGTVNVRTATLVRALRAAVDPHIQLVRRERLIPEGLDVGAFFDQQRAEFELSADVAAAVGLRAAGLRVDPQALRGEGAVVLRVVQGGPAQALVRSGDVIVAVNGRAVTTDAEYRAVVEELGWEPLTLQVTRGAETREVRLAPGETRSGEPSLGLVVSTHRPEVWLPVDVRVASDKVGGPSAGLAIALTVFDLAAPDDVLQGRRVVATGTVDTQGRVGPIGGVALKAVAAERAGVDVLLVPARQVAQARAAIGGDSPVRLIGVATFDEALRALATDGAVVHAAA